MHRYLLCGIDRWNWSLKWVTVARLVRCSGKQKRNRIWRTNSHFRAMAALSTFRVSRLRPLFHGCYVRNTRQGVAGVPAFTMDGWINLVTVRLLLLYTTIKPLATIVDSSPLDFYGYRGIRILLIFLHHTINIWLLFQTGIATWMCSVRNRTDGFEVWVFWCFRYNVDIRVVVTFINRLELQVSVRRFFYIPPTCFAICR